MSDQAGPRPRQVTFAGGLAAAACVVLVVSLFDAMSTVRSQSVREGIAEFLSKPPGDGLGLDVAGVVDLLRGVVLFSGALAAAGAVLAIYALRRHRGARVGLTVTAVLLMLFATFVSGFLPILVAVGAAMMWGREARDWFAGRTPASSRLASQGTPPGSSRSSSSQGPSGQPGPPGPWRPDDRPVSPDDQTGPGPQQVDEPGGPPGPWARPYASPYASPYGRPDAASPYASPYAQPSGPHGHHQGRVGMGARPVAVLWAAWLTWVASALAAASGLLVVLTILVDHRALVGELQRNAAVAQQGWSGQQILGFLWVTVAVLIAWSLAAAALAWLVWRRVELARILLIISSVAAAFFGLVAVPVGWVHAAAAVATVVLLSRRSTRDWCAGRSTPAGPPPPPSQTSQTSQPSPPPSRPQGKPPVW